MSTHAAAFDAIAPGSRALVLGLGRTGLSAARYLRRSGFALRVADSRAEPPAAAELRSLMPDVELRCGPFDASLLDDVAQVVISPGLSLGEPIVQQALARGLPVAGDVELFAREVRAPVAAVTGTNGKSTVTTLVAEFAIAAGRSALAGGNLGRPALDLLDAPLPDLYVLELSSFQLETTHSLAAAAAVVTNVSADHMDRYASLADYAATKARIYDRAEVAVVNADDALVSAMPRDEQRLISFSLRDPGADYWLAQDPEPTITRRGEPLLPLAAMRLKGLHNAANAMAALAMGEALGLPRASALTVLAGFAGLPHRSQWVAEIGGVSFVNDSKGTNVGATVAAVAGMPGPLVLIAGGDGKGQDFSELREACRGKVRLAVLIGRDAPRLAEALEGACATLGATDMREAVAAARDAAEPGDTVLLSPACASLDMYRDYTERGDQFAAEVRSLAR